MYHDLSLFLARQNFPENVFFQDNQDDISFPNPFLFTADLEDSLLILQATDIVDVYCSNYKDVKCW